MSNIRRSKQWQRSVEVTSPPPLRYLKETISVIHFSSEIGKFLEKNFMGSYSVAFEEVRYRELYISFDGFAAFVYSNFAAAGYSFQHMRISTHIDGSVFRFIMEYDTSLITDNHRENMKRSAERSGFDFVIEDQRVIAIMPTERNFALDIRALRNHPLYNALARIFSMYGDFID